MRKFRFFNSLIIALLAFGFAAVAELKAQDEMPPDHRPPRDGRRQQRPRLLEELNLSPEQIQQIRSINQSRRPQMQQAQRRLHEANRALDAAIYAASPSEADVQERMKEVQAAQAEIIKIRTASELAVRKVLTPEQLEKFRELREKFMRRLRKQQNPPPEMEEEPGEHREVNNPNRPNLNPQRRRRGF
ncbi:MAG: Spy/CpxP family protein refolding chaperone [Acidobacteriota bacterium]|nr:Spy/CpxP family protein refolding chaperone [Acidobacteriota bacterium]